MALHNNVSPLRPRLGADRLRCIVVESGAAGLTSPSAGFDETIVVTQTADELPAIFAQRVLARIASAERGHRRFESLVLQTGDRDDSASRAVRRLILLGMAAHGRAGAVPAELLLSASPWLAPERRVELLGLIEEVLASKERPLPVRLVFGVQPQPAAELGSGIFAKAIPRRRRAAS
ncbi:MAG TPA: hypothetical protein VHP33_28370 [Polyangiaceae bacterium]|nr:hypothetical protein [Polyangiaceae bacterium]